MALWWLLIALVGCGDDAPQGDATPDATPDAAPPIATVLPADPMPPRLTPCAAGFVERDLYGATVCEPLVNAQTTCPPGEARFLDGAACERLSPPCPDGDWPDEADIGARGRVIYVRPTDDYANGGSGTPSDPYTSLAAASALSVSGDVIQIAKGTYSYLQAQIESGVTVRGACTEGTRLRGHGLSFHGQSARFEHLTMDQTGYTVFGSERGAMATFEGIVVEGKVTTVFDLRDGAEAFVRNVVFAPTQGLSEDGYTLITADSGSQVHVARANFVGARLSAIALGGEGTLVELDHVAIYDTFAPDDTVDFGVITLESGARLTGKHVVIDGADLAGVLVYGGSSLVLEDSIVRNVATDSLQPFGQGVVALMDGDITLRRTLVERTQREGVLAGNRGHIALEDVVIADTRVAGREGHALAIKDNGHIDGSRVLIGCAERAPIVVDGAGARAVLEDIDVLADERCRGIGVVIQNAGAIDATRMRITGTARSGMNLLFGASAILRDVAIHDVESVAVVGEIGRGINVQRASLDAERLWIANTREAAISVIDGDATLRDVTLEGVRPQACIDTTCEREAGGFALTATESARVTLERFTVRDAALCGVLLDDAMLDLSGGTVEHCPIGACIQTDYDLNRLMSGVDYRNNIANLDATRLPVPAPIPDEDL